MSNLNCVEDKTSNITEIESFVENNIHEYESFLYGFKEDYFISLDLMMVLEHSLMMKIAFYISSHNINLSIKINDLKLHQYKFLTIDYTLIQSIDLTLKKDAYVKIHIGNLLQSKIKAQMEKQFKISNILFSMIMKNIKSKEIVAELIESDIDESGNVTIKEILKSENVRTGLNLKAKILDNICEIPDVVFSLLLKNKNGSTGLNLKPKILDNICEIPNIVFSLMSKNKNNVGLNLKAKILDNRCEIPDATLSFVVASVNEGKSVSEFSKYKIADLADITVSDMLKSENDGVGLKLKIRKQ